MEEFLLSQKKLVVFLRITATTNILSDRQEGAVLHRIEGPASL